MKTQITLIDRIIDNKTDRMIHVNQAWSKAVVKDISYGVQITSNQEQQLIGQIIDELEIPGCWTKEEIDEFEATELLRWY